MKSQIKRKKIDFLLQNVESKEVHLVGDTDLKGLYPRNAC